MRIYSVLGFRLQRFPQQPQHLINAHFKSLDNAVELYERVKNECPGYRWNETHHTVGYSMLVYKMLEGVAENGNRFYLYITIDEI